MFGVSESGLSYESPDQLTLIIFNSLAKNGNSLLHRLVVANPHPSASRKEMYLSAFLRSLPLITPVNSLNEKGYTALHVAVLKNNNHMAEKLLSCIKHLNVNSKSRSGDTALNLAVCLGYPDIIQTLLNNGANINEAGCSDNRPLHFAVVNFIKGNSGVQQMLRDDGFDLEVKNAVDDASRDDYCKLFEIFKLLITQKADINSKNRFGFTPLHYATMLTNPKCLQYLLESGADVNIEDNEYVTPLHIAALTGEHEAVEILISRGANVNCICIGNQTPLHYACENGKSKAAEVLLRNRATINALDEYDATPLHLALRRATSHGLNRHRDVINLLKLSGANIHAQDILGQSPLTIAQEEESSDFVEMLMSKKRRM